MGWACGAYGWGEGVYRLLLGKSEGRRPLGRPRLRWVDNIRMDLQEVECGYMDWIGLAQDRERCWTLVSAVMNLRVPWNAGNFLTSCKPVSFSRRTLHHIYYLFIAIGLSPGGSGYFTCKQNMKLVTTKFKSVGLYEKHVVATWNLGNHLSICF